MPLAKAYAETAASAAVSVANSAVIAMGATLAAKPAGYTGACIGA